MSTTFQATAIGTIETSNGAYSIQVAPEYRPGLTELSGFGHIHVLFWCDKLDSPEYRAFVSCPKPYRKAPETVGVFATRSPARPNPIALTICQVTAIDPDEGTVHVAYIDADHGSPLLDIKPYHPGIDRVRDPQVPQWCAHWPAWYEDVAAFDWAAEFVHAQ